MALTLPTLSDGEITLRPASPDDMAAFVAACQDPEIARWTSVPSPYGPEDAHQYLSMCVADALAGTAARLVAVDADDRLVGSLSVMEIDRERRYGEIGYWVAAEARGRGAATRGVLLLRDWAAAELGLTRLEILAHRKNLASQRVAERAGFAATGEVRTHPREEQPEPPSYLVFAWSPA